MIKYNGNEITPNLNGSNLSRVMFNEKQIYPIYASVIDLIIPEDGLAKRYRIGSKITLFDLLSINNNLGLVFNSNNIKNNNYEIKIEIKDGTNSIDNTYIVNATEKSDSVLYVTIDNDIDLTSIFSLGHYDITFTFTYNDIIKSINTDLDIVTSGGSGGGGR